MEHEECKSTLDLMQPEVLSVEVLRQVLSQRLVTSDVSEAPKSTLVELWHRLVTPLPQRVYRNTRAGRWYAARQRRPRALPPSDRDWEELGPVPSGSQPKPAAASPRVSAPGGSTAAPPSVSRLKPPPAAVTGEKRIIRLSGGGAGGGGGKRSSEGGLDRVVIKRRTSAGESPRATPAPLPSAAAPVHDPVPLAASPVGEPAAAAPVHDPVPPAASPVVQPAAASAPPGEPATVAENNGHHGDSAKLNCDIKAKLKQEKRKIKIRRKSPGDPEPKRVAIDP